jgi:nucleoside-diphosphate-sugar epimerase
MPVRYDWIWRMNESPILVLGATGSFGGGIVRELLARGRTVRALARHAGKVRERFATTDLIEVVEGDALDAQAVEKAAAGCDAIVHGVNYPYAQWAIHMPPATRNVIAAARRHHCAILFPGNVYGIGRQTDRPLNEAVEMRPCSRKGSLRVELETALREAADDGAIQAIVLRAGDFYGPTVRNPVVDRLFGNAVNSKPMETFGRPDVAHQWSFMPDLARVGVELLDHRAGLAPFEIFHFPGHVCFPASTFMTAIAQEAGQPDLAVRTLPWWAVRLIGLWDSNARELLELRYLWDEGVILGDTKISRHLPNWRGTPLREAIRLTLAHYEGGSMTEGGIDLANRKANQG